MTYYELIDPAERSKRGVIEIGEDGTIQRFLEKPSSTETTTLKACPAFYFYRAHAIPKILDCVEASKTLPLDKRDAPGALVKWFVESGGRVKALAVDGRFDIGSLSSYKDTLAYFMNHS